MNCGLIKAIINILSLALFIDINYINDKKRDFLLKITESDLLKINNN